MLSETKLSLLHQLVQDASKDEIIWTKGYLAGFLNSHNSTIIDSIKEDTITTKVKPLILYGTETGNSKRVASQLLAGFKKNKIQAKSVDIFQFDIEKLQKESLVLFVISTQGEGEFPQNAVNFYEKLNVSTTDLSALSFAVLGLGDSSYPLFCNAGILLETVLLEKGAKRLLPLVKADVDFVETVVEWEQQLQTLFNTKDGIIQIVNATEASRRSESKKRNYRGKISHKVVLNDIGSNKETYHIEIQSDEDVLYEPGDALGIIPKNRKTDVDFILNYFEEKASRIYEQKGQSRTLEEWLAQSNIKGLNKRLLSQLPSEFTINSDKEDLIDILQLVKRPKHIVIEQVLAHLLPIAPRLYSISSSPEAHEGEIHLTVNLHKFLVREQEKTGLASQFLTDYPIDTELEFYIHKNQNFRLPADDSDIILIGPGTGIAPFRGFLAHRDATGATGKNWLFFGEQHFVDDFYYQTEIQEWLATGVLTKLSTSFSRDQKEKIYVQDRIKENAKELNDWIENGASIYVCGQKTPMSHDVETAIIEAIATQRKITINEAKQTLEDLETNGNYHKDVY